MSEKVAEVDEKEADSKKPMYRNKQIFFFPAVTYEGQCPNSRQTKPSQQKTAMQSTKCRGLTAIKP